MAQITADFAFHLLRFVVRSNVYFEKEATNVYSEAYYRDRQLQLQKLASVGRFWRNSLHSQLYKDLYIVIDQNGRSRSYIPAECLQYVLTLYLKVNSCQDSNAGVNPLDIVAELQRILPGDMPHLARIVVDSTKVDGTATVLGPNDDYDDANGGNGGSSVAQLKLRFPALQCIRINATVCGMSGGVIRTVGYAAARCIAQAADSSLVPLGINDTPLPTKPFDVDMPIFTRSLSSTGGGSGDIYITRLAFTDVSLIADAAILIKRCASRLEELSFLLCHSDIFRQIVTQSYKPVYYPKLRILIGAICRGSEYMQFTVPSGVFPKLEYLYETAIYEWQYAHEVRSHLLTEMLTKSGLPSLRQLQVKTSTSMNLDTTNLQKLVDVCYYNKAERHDDTHEETVKRLFERLMGLPELRTLTLHDNVPSFFMSTPFDVQCMYLTYLNLGTATMPHFNLEYLLLMLKHLRTLFLGMENN
ncbi:hypothetical protein GGI12_000083 [Dipsacomyces acuminosporus]|nr:hypothetical protein GGI12_000083 [Dipsacomyces acuminosporus]